MTPTSVHGPFERTAPRDGGFTLIELLVVLLIMGLMVGMASLVVRPDDSGLLRIEANRLALLLDLAAQEARLGGRDIAWTSDGPGYRFSRSAADTGPEVRVEQLLRPRALPTGMTISGLSIENRRLPGPMRLEFRADGPAMAYDIELVLGTASYGVVSSPIGKLSVSDRGNADGASPSP